MSVKRAHHTRSAKIEPAQFFSVSLELVHVSGPDGYFRRLNPAFKHAFGYTDADLLGQPFIPFVHVDDRDATQAELQKLGLGLPALDFENRLRGKDGNYHWLSWTAMPGPEGLVYAAARDITDHKLKNAERTGRSTAGQAATLAAKAEFLVSVSHDLHQPLTIIKGQAQVLQRLIARGEKIETERLDRALGYINAAVMRMGSMLQDLLDTSLEQAGYPLRLRPVPTDLVALLRQAMAEYELAFELHHFDLKSDQASLWVTLDLERMQRVIENLLSNATKYSPAGGPIQVVVSAPAHGAANVLFSIQDSGVGIPAADVPLVFERFHRGANVVGRFAGNGLGLAGARQIVEMHGGTLSVQSEEGVGTIFTVSLPVDATADTGASTPIPRTDLVHARA
ncbi:MAG: PAS domain-containing sensor histidine kinase [Chloroflexi bacterium]|nr:PAS domain-containing sensor histidine kinase [Chloroflexota bacterium]